MMNPSILLTAPLLDGAGGTTAPPSPGAMSTTAVQTAFQTLQTDLKTDIPSGAQPTHASVGALQDDLDAIRKGTLSGTAAQTKIQSDQAAILSSMGLTATQITQLQTDQTALQTAISAASSASTTTSGSTSTSAAVTTLAGRHPPSKPQCKRFRRTFKTTRPAGLEPRTLRSARSRMTWMRSATGR